MSLRINDTAPDSIAETTQSAILRVLDLMQMTAKHVGKQS